MTEPAISPPEVPTDSTSAPERASQRGAAPVVHLLEIVQTVLTALILAFVFRAFFIEAFIIPTGSMAPGLLGEHTAAVCPECGWAYDFGPSDAARGRGGAFTPPDALRCPNCQRSNDVLRERALPVSGDRILVQKWPHLLGGLLGLKRWDVIVFRDPADPYTNYIKRLIGLPGEAVEIVDGDVYINGEIARKPRYVQSALWSIVFDQAHIPVAADDEDGPHAWRTTGPPQPDGEGWLDLNRRVIRYAANDEVERSLVFEPHASAWYLRDVCGYNGDSTGEPVGDVRLSAILVPGASRGRVTFCIVRDGNRFTATVDSGGEMTLTRSPEGRAGDSQRIGLARIRPLTAGRPLHVELEHADYRVALVIDGVERIATDDAQYAPDLSAARGRVRTAPPRLSIASAGMPIELRGLRIERDVHYRSGGRAMLRAGPGDALPLGGGEYFVLGDNSPASHDSREWARVGPHLQRRAEAGEYRLGTVPEDQIVGRAIFVYLPGVMPLSASGAWRIPDLGRVRFVR